MSEPRAGTEVREQKCSVRERVALELLSVAIVKPKIMPHLSEIVV